MTTNTDRALALLDDAGDRIDDAETVLITIRELVERINSGLIDADSRADLGGDILAAAERLAAYGVTVIG